MKLKCIGCEALARSLYFYAAHSCHLIDITLFKIGLHDTPEKLRAKLQMEIDTASEGEYDAILMAYGLCGNSTVGLQASRIRVVIPRAHDCITLFLGNRKEYQQQFEKYPGTYWYVLDYLERRNNTDTTLALGASVGKVSDKQYDEYVQKYGLENAQYLMTVMGTWQDHYQRAVFIDMNLGESKAVEDQARHEATQYGWQFEKIDGNPTLIKQLFSGDWDSDFVIISPGQQLSMTYDQRILESVNLIPKIDPPEPNA
jgi:hypothetical protein